MKIPVSFRTSYARADKQILVDSGATDNFIDPRLIKRLGLRSLRVTDLQGPPSEHTQMKKIRDLKSLARQYARDQGSCDDTRISYLEYVESEAEADWTLARMIAG
jgi:hypothetical protein